MVRTKNNSPAKRGTPVEVVDLSTTSDGSSSCSSSDRSPRVRHDETSSADDGGQVGGSDDGSFTNTPDGADGEAPNVDWAPLDVVNAAATDLNDLTDEGYGADAEDSEGGKSTGSLPEQDPTGVPQDVPEGGVSPATGSASAGATQRVDMEAEGERVAGEGSFIAAEILLNAEEASNTLTTLVTAERTQDVPEVGAIPAGEFIETLNR
jgi:hypothetical protein